MVRLARIRNPGLALVPVLSPGLALVPVLSPGLAQIPVLAPGLALMLLCKFAGGGDDINPGENAPKIGNDADKGDEGGSFWSIRPIWLMGDLT